MIANNDRHNNEFYPAPIYNYTLKDCIVKSYEVEAHNFSPWAIPDLTNHRNTWWRS